MSYSLYVNYLVVGGNGYLGLHLVDQLLSKGHGVFVFDNKAENIRFQRNNKVNYIFGDITSEFDFNRLNSYPKFDGIFHLAAKKSVSESMINPELYDRVNIKGTQNVVRYCLANGIRNVVFTSSAATYGPCDTHIPIIETSPTNPINPYGTTKLKGEEILADAVSRDQVSAVSLRVFNIVGASNPNYFDIKGENVIPIMLRSIFLKEVFTIFGFDLDTKDGSSVRDYVNVSDVAAAHLNAMDYLHSSPSGTYVCANISSGIGTSMLDLVKGFNLLSDIKLDWLSLIHI